MNLKDDRYKCIVPYLTWLGVFLIFTISGCATPAEIKPVDPFPDVDKMSADCTVQIRKLRFSGSLEGRSKKLYKPFLGAFAEVGEEIKCVHDSDYADATMDVLIHTEHASTTGSKFKYLPIIGGMTYIYSGGTLSFNWKGKVDFSVHDTNGNLLLNDSFELKGHDTMKPKGGFYGMGVSYFTGAGVQAALYPDGKTIARLGDEYLKTAGFEIAKRLRKEPISSYFVERTSARDGMDAKTYAEFMAKKERLKNERAAIKLKQEGDLSATVENKEEYFDLGDGNIMVFGIGVDQYDHFPDLKYAARDCRRFVNLLKSRYELSDDWAMALTDKEATAIKVIRFIERNAAKLLTEQDTFIFYFSGHGAPEVATESTDEDGLRKYLLLPNSEPDALTLTAISLNDLADLLKNLPCKKVIVFIDSCFSGLAGKETLSKLKGIRISNRTYKNFATISGQGRVIIAASAENQVSQELDDIKAGVFTHWLIQGLNVNGGLDQNEKIDIFELFKYVKKNVETQTSGAQTPVFRGALDRNIVF
jgi:hypothetical protein